MSAIFVKEIAGVVKDAELKFTQQGKAITKVYMAFSDSRKNEQTQEWESLNQFFVEGTAWEHTAEQLAEAGTKGAQLLVWGKLATDQWEDKQTGDKRSKPSLKVQGFRPVGRLPQVGQSQSSAPPQSQGWGQSQPQSDVWGGNGGWGDAQGGAPAF